MTGAPVDIAKLADLAQRAGDQVLAVYESDFQVDTKADQSPVTAADLCAHATIAAGLRQLAPTIPMVSEESTPPPFRVRRRWRRFWLVDPLDGTKEFIDRNGDFTVNIALVEDHRPVLGVVGAPAHDRVYVGAGSRAYCLHRGARTPLRARAMAEDAVTVVASRSHRNAHLARYIDALGERFATVDARSVGSSLKFCLLAEGRADVYPRLGPTSEWDTAAAHAVLQAAGGEVRRFDGSPLAYGDKASLLNPHFYAVGDPAYPWQERLPPAAAGA